MVSAAVGEFTGLVVSQPNLFGVTEEVDAAIPGVGPLSANRAHIPEVAFGLPKPATEVVEPLSRTRSSPACRWARKFPQHGDALLVCTNESKSADDLEAFAQALAAALK